MDSHVRRGNDHDPSWFAAAIDAPRARRSTSSSSARGSPDASSPSARRESSACKIADRGQARSHRRELLRLRQQAQGSGCRSTACTCSTREHERVWEYVNRFSEWTPYEHRVKGKVDVGEGYKIVPIPPSRETVNALFHADVHTEEEMEAWLNARRSVNDDPKNGEESALTRAGESSTTRYSSTTRRSSGTSTRRSWTRACSRGYRCGRTTTTGTSATRTRRFRRTGTRGSSRTW